MEDFINRLKCIFGIHDWKVIRRFPYENVYNELMEDKIVECRRCGKTKTKTSRVI